MFVFAVKYMRTGFDSYWRWLALVEWGSLCLFLLGVNVTVNMNLGGQDQKVDFQAYVCRVLVAIPKQLGGVKTG
jgi:hypothetical protein